MFLSFLNSVIAISAQTACAKIGYLCKYLELQNTYFGYIIWGYELFQSNPHHIYKVVISHVKIIFIT